MRGPPHWGFVGTSEGQAHQRSEAGALTGWPTQLVCSHAPIQHVLRSYLALDAERAVGSTASETPTLETQKQECHGVMETGRSGSLRPG